MSFTELVMFLFYYYSVRNLLNGGMLLQRILEYAIM